MGTNLLVDDLLACETGRDAIEEVMDMAGVGVPVCLPDDTVGEMLAKRSLMLEDCRGATGCGAAKGVEEVIVEVAGGGDARHGTADRCASVVNPGVVAD